ncbi:hypothetical protein C4571_01985 [Candidatus Parcubacteria bacterium]|nr:MAG: hypothetical protein C4571_01985 [Candidatus Parcubacteria bacterium]
MNFKMPKPTPGFRITGKKGFHMTFENGYTVSIQFGPGDYCDNYDMEIGEQDEAAGANGSSNAEYAVWGQGGEMIQYGDWGDTVSNRSTPAQVLELLNWAANQPAMGNPDALAR